VVRVIYKQGFQIIITDLFKEDVLTNEGDVRIYSLNRDYYLVVYSL